MKLLLDQNISRKLVKELESLFPGSNHVYPLGLHKASDEEIWDYARDNGLTIVTQDSDFNEKKIRQTSHIPKRCAKSQLFSQQ